MDLFRVTFLVGAHCLVAAACALLAIGMRRPTAIWVGAVWLIAVAAISYLSLALVPPTPLLSGMWEAVRIKSGNSLVAIGLGAATAMPWIWFVFRPEAGANWRNTLLSMIAILSPITLMLSAAVLILRDARNDQGPANVICLDDRYEVTEVGNLGGGFYDAVPICVVVDEHDDVYVSMQLPGRGNYTGQILKLTPSRSGGRPDFRVIADSPCLFRPYGLAIRDKCIYVSRSGFMAHAESGRISYDNSGVVTKLQDLDGDGVMDYYDDVVTGLPGCRGPVPEHSNNVLTFDREGRLYIAQSSNSDRDSLTHPWEATLLRTSPDFNEVNVYCRGLRNVFGIAWGIDDQLFVADNDVTIGDPGDELNLVVEGAHFGHPYAVGEDDGGGAFTKPLYLGKNSSFAGLAFSDAEELPDDHRGSLILADYMGDQLLRVSLHREGDTYRTTATPFAKIHAPLSIAATSKGDFYITTHKGYLFRISPRE